MFTRNYEFINFIFGGDGNISMDKDQFSQSAIDYVANTKISDSAILGISTSKYKNLILDDQVQKLLARFKMKLDVVAFLIEEIKREIANLQKEISSLEVEKSLSPEEKIKQIRIYKKQLEKLKKDWKFLAVHLKDPSGLSSESNKIRRISARLGPVFREKAQNKKKGL